MSDDHWFADVSDDPISDGFLWQPFLQLNGCCLPLPLWFPTQADCERFIHTSIPAGAA